MCVWEARGGKILAINGVRYFWRIEGNDSSSKRSLENFFNLGDLIFPPQLLTLIYKFLSRRAPSRLLLFPELHNIVKNRSGYALLTSHILMMVVIEESFITHLYSQSSLTFVCPGCGVQAGMNVNYVVTHNYLTDLTELMNKGLTD